MYRFIYAKSNHPVTLAKVLEDEVSKVEQDGWTPQGGPAILKENSTYEAIQIMVKEKKKQRADDKNYEIFVGQGNTWDEAATNLEKEINPLLQEGHSVNGAPFVLSSDVNGITLAQCILYKNR